MLLTRECVLNTPGYVPGEQPKYGNLIKLNTNENHYPPPFELLPVLQDELSKVNLYPDPVCSKLRETAATVYGVSSEQIITGNGSDDILNIAIRTFVNPGETIAFLDVTYSLYETLALVHGASIVKIPTNGQFELSQPVVCPEAKLIFFASPNPPLGKHLNRQYLEATCAQATGIVVIDEAYVNFADYDHLDLLQKYDNVILVRTMSKAYSLAGARVGFGIASKSVLEQMNKVRDSYNVDRLAQALATAAFQHQDKYQQIWDKIRQTGKRLITSLRDLDFFVFNSEANFVLASPKWIPASQLYTQLREKEVLVRYFNHPRILNYVRISVGTEPEIDRLLETIQYLKAQRA